MDLSFAAKAVRWSGTTNSSTTRVSNPRTRVKGAWCTWGMTRERVLGLGDVFGVFGRLEALGIDMRQSTPARGLRVWIAGGHKRQRGRCQRGGVRSSFGMGSIETGGARDAHEGGQFVCHTCHSRLSIRVDRASEIGFATVLPVGSVLKSIRRKRQAIRHTIALMKNLVSVTWIILY
ncbi:hypothetical protein FIBSPDRAFT_591441 [Athelia psychrophila]|uniref:Uncharacterized protein n=1 Tax=Athelia psychrophila TaxID=1759441 RepID=A0A166H2M9_9AGAM|nr:hypothetical protein FIBSPDRAFT_591441 [Fibularhizoctonia sp. CBS 109695]